MNRSSYYDDLLTTYSHDSVRPSRNLMTHNIELADLNAIGKDYLSNIKE